MPPAIQSEIDQFDRDIQEAIKISRDAIYKIVVLSSGIVGFSLSLFSVSLLEQNLNFYFVKIAWYLFLAVIILGTFILLADGRTKYAITWKGNQTSVWKDDLSLYSLKEKLLAFLIVIWTLIYPANLVFNLVYKEEKERNFKQSVNAVVVHWLARLKHILVFLENILFILFVLALVYLIKSFTY